MNRSYPVWRGGRTVVVGRPYPAYQVGYGSGCHTTRSVGITPWGWRRIVTTKTCIVP